MVGQIRQKGSIFWSLFIIQLANWRWSWAPTVINGLIVPITAMFFLKNAVGTTHANDAFIISGNIVISLIFTTMYGTSARFAFMRSFGVLDYYATLAVPKVLLVLAVNAGFLVLTLPTALLTIVLGQFIFNLNLSFNPLFLVLVPLASFSLSAFGAFVGVSAPNFDSANSIMGILQFVFLGFSPILVPIENQPVFMQIIGYFLPSTYAADVLRHSLANNYDATFLFDLALLLGFNVAVMIFVSYKMEWRRD
jgi:ABC-2 type transport system permease protein